MRKGSWGVQHRVVTGKVTADVTAKASGPMRPKAVNAVEDFDFLLWGKGAS